MSPKLWSQHQFLTRFYQLRDGVSEGLAAARSRMLLEKTFDQQNSPEEVRVKARAALAVPFIPADVGEAEAQIMARLSPEDAAARLGELLGSSDAELKQAVEHAKEPLNSRDYQRLAARQLDKMKFAPMEIGHDAYDRRFFLEQGGPAYSVTLALEPDALDDAAYKRGVERFMAGTADEMFKERVWTLVCAPSSAPRFHALARWYEQACPVVHLTRPDYTASLASTAVTAEEPVLPWRSVLVELPEKVVPYDGGGWVRSILVHRHSLTTDGSTAWNVFVFPSDPSLPAMWAHGQPWSAWCAEDLDSESEEAASFRDPTLHSYGDENLNDRDNRCMLICRRIVAGMCHAMSSPDDWRPTKSADVRASNTRTQKQPTCRVYLLGRPVNVDCRLAVRQYVEQGTKHGPLTLQLLVRGHWRRQAIGTGRSERKWIRIEPYWKGPEDAPVRVRSHELAGDEA
jgi:hypothetical protein